MSSTATGHEGTLSEPSTTARPLSDEQWRDLARLQNRVERGEFGNPRNVTIMQEHGSNSVYVHVYVKVHTERLRYET